MSVFFFLIPLTLIIASLLLYVLFWCFRNDQFEDLDKHSTKILHDDD